MCGFAGFIDRPNRIADPASAMTLMSEAIRHRGPDGEGRSFDASRRIGLVHRRLAIQDPSEAGAQPMRSASDRFELVYNGEIYDFLELRAELETAGHHFRGKSDTEVLLAGFDAWGIEATLQRVDGMFAFAVIDRREGRLTLARDQAGQKPLLLAVAGECIAFASDLRALEVLPDPFARKLAGINEDAFRWFLANGAIPWPFSIRPGVEHVPPGGLIEIDLERGRIDRRRWWTPPTEFLDDSDGQSTREDDASQVLEAVRTSVHRQCRSDRPIGVFLSAGLDSRIVAALAAEIRPKIPTFTLGMAGPFDETGEAATIAARLGLPHRIIRPSEEDTIEAARTLHSVADEPFSDSSLLATVLLSRAASPEIAVALGGDGGDELFGGYRRHLAAANLGGFKPWAMRRIAGIGNLLPDSISGRIKVGRGTLREASYRLKNTELGHEGYLRLRGTQGDAAELFESGPLAARGRSRRNPWDGLAPEWKGVRSMMAADFRTYLPDDPLVKVDRGSMCCGMEYRSPMLGRDVISTAWSLGTDRLFDARGGRAPVRAALRSLGLPDRGAKRGFAIPLSKWLRGPLQEWAESLVLADFEDPIDQRALRDDWRLFEGGRSDLAVRLWTIVCWRAWLTSRH
ncbi:MAG: asparagine synthase (glutamine-hydrolyzing) [Planctomycetota bacterium]|jgi:asparagine synthase (glutamine-hydrolysing)|nr:asparagine synthase (glutamine-hydrolyzing) [Planctomycetota bacterium]MDA1026219.1 asparagine synthase (glutamine-hydrolyzing) [Planctomycetota bacterium]